MNWKIEGTKADGKPGSTRVTGARTEEEAREYMKGAHPDFTVEKVTPLNQRLNVSQAAAAAAESPAAPARKSGKH